MTSIKLQLLGLASMFVLCVGATAVSAETTTGAPESVAVTAETAAVPPISESAAPNEAATTETTPTESAQSEAASAPAATTESAPTTESTTSVTPVSEPATTQAANTTEAQSAGPATESVKVDETRTQTETKTEGCDKATCPKSAGKALKKSKKDKASSTRNIEINRTASEPDLEGEEDDSNTRAMQYIQTQSNKPLKNAVTQPIYGVGPGAAAAATLTQGATTADTDSSFLKPSLGSGLDSSFLKPSFGAAKTPKAGSKSSKKPATAKK